MGFPTLEEKLKEVARAMGLPSHEEQQVEEVSDPLLAELAALEAQYPVPELPPLGGLLDVLKLYK